MYLGTEGGEAFTGASNRAENFLFKDLTDSASGFSRLLRLEKMILKQFKCKKKFVVAARTITALSMKYIYYQHWEEKISKKNNYSNELVDLLGLELLEL